MCSTPLCARDLLSLCLAILPQCELVLLQIYITLWSWEGPYNQDAYKYLFHKLIRLVSFLSFLVNMVDMSLELLLFNSRSLSLAVSPFACELNQQEHNNIMRFTLHQLTHSCWTCHIFDRAMNYDTLYVSQANFVTFHLLYIINICYFM
jgi:hypothetical protein